MDRLAAFVARWAGQLSCDGGYCECVALVNQWADWNGWPKPQGVTAATLSFGAGWSPVPLAQLQRGDVLIWGADLPGSGGDGHTAIYLDAQANPTAGFSSFDQNFGGATAHVQAHGWPYLAGAWRYQRMLSDSEIRERVRTWFLVGLGREPSDGDLANFAGAVLADGSNVEQVAISVYDSAEAQAWRAHLAAQATPGVTEAELETVRQELEAVRNTLHSA